MNKLFDRFRSKTQQTQGSHGVFMNVGFHGDKYLLELADTVLKNATVFFETGTNVGTTLAYVAGKYPHLQCISCEPDPQAFLEAVQHTKHLPNVFVFNESSQQFLKFMRARFGHLMDHGRAAFWLDAHGYGFEWPLREEVQYITTNFESAYVMIDDFKVPGLDMFGFDQHGEQVCSWDFIKSSLKAERKYQLYYPAYTDRTSPHHPLRGWGLIHYGPHAGFEVPVSLKNKVSSSTEM